MDKKLCMTSKGTREADPDVDPSVAEIDNPTDAKYETTDCM